MYWKYIDLFTTHLTACLVYAIVLEILEKYIEISKLYAELCVAIWSLDLFMHFPNRIVLPGVARIFFSVSKIQEESHQVVCKVEAQDLQ